MIDLQRVILYGYYLDSDTLHCISIRGTKSFSSANSYYDNNYSSFSFLGRYFTLFMKLLNDVMDKGFKHVSLLTYSYNNVQHLFFLSLADISRYS